MHSLTRLALVIIATSLLSVDWFCVRKSSVSQHLRNEPAATTTRSAVLHDNNLPSAPATSTEESNPQDTDLVPDNSATNEITDIPDATAQAPTRSLWNEPMATAWPAANRWNERFETEFSQFVERLGSAVASRQCGRLDRCLRDPRINPLYDALSDARLSLHVDCADLPYILRAYYAFKRRLPFGFVSHVQGRGRDPRYMSNVRPNEFRQWQQFRTPRQLLSELSNIVHSGMYRLNPEVETGDFYPINVSRQAIRPGSIYYDPNGHVLMVAQVRNDGVVYLIDGHPDGSLTWKRFGEAFALGERWMGGGFKSFRPIELTDQGIVRAPNSTLANFNGTSQWDTSLRGMLNNRRVSFHSWVRSQLAQSGIVRDPVQDFQEQLQALCTDIHDRETAVNLASSSGIANRPHPARLPWNIYGTDGEWEMYSTPSRDARLKAAVREIYDHIANSSTELYPSFRETYQRIASSQECRFSYENSNHVQIHLTLDQVLGRLFLLSFDPYHCIELRWGALEIPSEIRSCPNLQDQRTWYRAESRLRNIIDQVYGVETPLTLGPLRPPDISIRRLLGFTR